MRLKKRHSRAEVKTVAARTRMRVTTLLWERPDLEFEERTQRAMREVGGGVLGEDARPADLVALAAQAVALADDLATEARKMAPPERPVACRAGCGHCCHISVAAAPAEIFRLAAHIRNRFSSDERAALTERLRAAAAMTRDERLAAYLPCPMLKRESCSIYEARPLNCRGLESMDAEICLRASHGEAIEVPLYRARWLIFNRILAGLVGGAEDAGREGEHLDLFPALLIALEDPRAPLRWLAGEPIFAGCRLTATPPPPRRP